MLFGGLATERPTGDADLLIFLADTIKAERAPDGNWLKIDDASWAELISINKAAERERKRQCQKKGHHQDLFADIFVATSECHYIGGLAVGWGNGPLKAHFKPLELREILLPQHLIELWPEIKLSIEPPEDVFRLLITPLYEEDGTPLTRVG
jgi:hypothetical protein